jgi:hypothetical protein
VIIRLILSPEKFLRSAERRPEIGEDMSRIAPVVPANTETKVAATLSRIKASLGNVSNVFALLANAPVALDGYLSLSKALRVHDSLPVNAKSWLWR